MLSISTRHPPSLRRAAALAAVTLAVCLSCLTITVRADSDIVFVTTITYALAKDPEVLRTACAVVQKNATPLVSPVMDTFAGLSAAMAAASVNYAYVSATMDTEQSNVWLWRNGGDLTSFGGIVTGNKWATNYPLNTSSLPYAVYSASLGALINVDGTTSYPIACTSDYYVPPVEELKGKKKRSSHGGASSSSSSAPSSLSPWWSRLSSAAAAARRRHRATTKRWIAITMTRGPSTTTASAKPRWGVAVRRPTAAAMMSRNALASAPETLPATAPSRQSQRRSRRVTG